MNSAATTRLLQFASSLEGERIPTLAGRAAFHIRVLPAGLEITPESTRKPRLVSRDVVERVLGEYYTTRSLTPARYQAITFDASYLLALIDRFNRQQAS